MLVLAVQYSSSIFLQTTLHLKLLMKKMWYIYMMKYYSATKKNETMPFTGIWMDLKIIVLRDVRQTKRIIYDIASMHNILKITQNNLFMRQKQTHRRRE